MRPRSKDVALLAGVSAATVSHVVNGTRFVSPATRERVLAAVTQLGYSSNAVARSLRRGRTGLLALVVTDIENPFCTRLARCVADAAFERGYQVILGDTGERADRERWLLDSFRQQHVVGVVLWPLRGPAFNMWTCSASWTFQSSWSTVPWREWMFLTSSATASSPAEWAPSTWLGRGTTASE